MNALSWLIYLAHAAGGMALVFSWAGGLLMAVTAISTFVALIHLDETDGRREPLQGNDLAVVRATREKAKRYAVRCGILGMCMFMVVSLIPDRRTVLLIAASEIGERVVTSERVIGVVDPSINLLQTWIEQQTASIRREMEAPRPAR